MAVFIFALIQLIRKSTGWRATYLGSKMLLDLLKKLDTDRKCWVVRKCAENNSENNDKQNEQTGVDRARRRDTLVSKCIDKVVYVHPIDLSVKKK